MKWLIVTTIVVSLALSRPRHPEDDIIIQGDRFFSQNDRDRTFGLEQLHEGHPLIVILRNLNEEDVEYDRELDNPVTISILQADKDKKSCTFSKMNSFCLLDEVDNGRKTAVRVSCKNTPCDVIWEAFQPVDKVNLPMEKIDKVHPFTLFNNTLKNGIIEFRTQQTDMDSLVDEMRLFINGEYDIMDDGDMAMYVLKTPTDGFFYEFSHERFERHTEIILRENAQEADISNTTHTAILWNERSIRILRVPKNQLRVEMSIQSMTHGPIIPFNISFKGVKGGTEQDITTFLIEPDSNVPGNDINLVLSKRQLKDFQSLIMKISCSQELHFSFRVNDDDVHDVDVEEECYFDLLKGEKAQYQIVSDKDADQNLTVHTEVIIEEGLNKMDIHMSENPCYYRKGCTMQVSAKEDVKAAIAIFLDKKQHDDVKYIPIEKSLSFELFQGQFKYLVHNTSKPQSFLVSVSSVNVMMYAVGGGAKCSVPSPHCFDYRGNSQKPIVIQNFTGQLYIAIEGMEIVRCHVRIDQADSKFELSDGVPLHFNMNKNKDLYFTYKLDKKQPVSFNLVAPPNSLSMVVSNSKEQPQAADNHPSSTSYLRFEEGEIDGLQFSILIHRLADKEGINFVLIASSHKSIFTLDRAEPHYEILEPNQPKYFAAMISYQEMTRGETLMLNVDVFQIKQDLNLTVSLGPEPDNMTDKLTVNKSPTLLDIHMYADKICEAEDEGDGCELFISLLSQKDHAIDVTLTLLSNNSVVRLRPGIWQHYVLSEVTSSNHFVFTPSNKKYPIALQFMHNYGEFKLGYNLWHNKRRSQNIGKWPFPQTNESVSSALFQSTEYIVSPKEVEACFPDCELLISLWGENKGGGFTFGNYRIMATDDILELVEDHKVTVTLAANESKYLLIDLKHVVESDRVLTINTHSILSYHECDGGLISSKYLTLPTESKYDFRLDAFETQLQMQEIRKKMDQKGINKNDDVGMAIYCKGYDTNRFAIEFTTKDKPIQKLTLGMPQTLIIPPRSEKYLSAEHYADYRVKITRTTNYPQIAYRLCDKSELIECYDNLSTDKLDKLTDKMADIREKYKENSILLIRISSPEDKVVLDITALSEFSPVELKEGQVLSDTLAANSTNLYKIHGSRDQNIVLTVTVFEGQPKVKVSNRLEGIDKQAIRKGNIISVTLNPAEYRQRQPGTNITMYTNYALTQAFCEFVVEVADTEQNSSYSISYSLGQRSLVLTDGVLTSALLKHNETVIFNYHNYRNGLNSIVSLSFGDTDMLQACDIQYTQSMVGGQPEIVKPDKQAYEKKMPRPTMTFHLSDNFSDYEIVVKNTKDKEVAINIIINHHDLVLLPFDYEYSSFVGAGEAQNLLVWVSNEGYVELVIKKCTQSDLNLAYTLDDDSYEKQDFSFEADVEEHIYTALIKAKVGSIYIRLKSQVGALFSLSAKFYFSKKEMPESEISPGNKGQIQYRVLEDRQLEVEFSPIQCKARCPTARYEYLLSNNQENVVNQVACPASIFLFQKGEILATVPIHNQKLTDGKIKFKLNVSKEVQFLGIKAILDDKREVPYPVVEVVTFWGGVQKNRHYLFMLSALSILCIVVCVITQFRRRARMNQRYEGLPDYQDNS